MSSFILGFRLGQVFRREYGLLS